MPIKTRIKYCEICKKDFPTMYRIQYKLPKKWIFACKECLLEVKEGNQNYVYGGTWKR